MNRLASNLLVFITAATAGTVFGILYAPDKGSSTRDRLTFRLDKFKDRLEDLLNELVKGKDMPDSEARSEGQKVITDAREKAEKLLDDVEDLIGQIKEKK